MNLDIIRNTEIEQCILGCMILDIKIILSVNNSSVKTKDFYHENHKILFNAINNVFKENRQVDTILLIDYLKKKELISKAGGITYITELIGSVTSNANIDNYINKLLDYSCKREILYLSKFIESNQELDNETLKTEIHKKTMELFDLKKSKDDMQNIGEEFLYMLEKRAKGEITDIKTGLKSLDDLIGGLNKAELITLFAFSGVGKTTLALQLAINIMKQNKKILFVSLEMTEEQLLERLNANVCNIKSEDLRTGNLKDGQWGEVAKATGYVCSDNRFRICRQNTLDEIIASIQLEKIKNDIDIVFIDYISLIETQKEERRDLTIAKMTRKFKLLANNLNIPIVILAQAKQSTYSKNGTNYKTHEKVSETDIGESAAIYRDSDKVIAMYRNVELDDPMARKVAFEERTLDYHSKDATYNPDCVNLLVKKCRNGKKATLSYKWEGQYYRISNFTM